MCVTQLTSQLLLSFTLSKCNRDELLFAHELVALIEISFIEKVIVQLDIKESNSNSFDTIKKEICPNFSALSPPTYFTYIANAQSPK
jgi:hypothetical protein